MVISVLERLSLAEDWPFLPVVIGAVLILLAMRYWDNVRRVMPSGFADPLFDELCRVHALDGAERALLIEAARGRELAQPAVAFVDPGVMIAHLKSGASDVAAGKALLVKLFGDALAPAKPHGG